MFETKADSYENLPLFHETQREFQQGNWASGLTRLQELEEAFPLEPELRNWRQEMALRARMDEIEVEEETQRKRNFYKSLALRMGGVALVIVLVVLGLRAFSRSIQEQWLSTRAQMEDQVITLELASQFRNGQNLLLANRPDEALVSFEKVAEVNPNYPDLDTFMGQARKMLELESTYQDALQLKAEGNYSGSLEKFQWVYDRDARYKDVSLQIKDLQKSLNLEDLFAQSAAAYGEERWNEAVIGLEALKAADLTYRQADVDELLYQSYINAAEARLSEQEPTLETLQIADEYYRKALALKPQNKEITSKQASARRSVETYLVNSYMNTALQALTGQEDSLDALQIAEDNFSKALALRPDDLQVITQLNLTRQYISGVESFNKGLWTQSINDLEAVYVSDKNYANGTARQTLFEAYTARGKNGLASGDYLAALDDFQRASVLSKETSDSALMLFESQKMVAYVQGLLGNYQEAALIYKVAVDQSDMRNLAQFKDTELADQIGKADLAYNAGNYEGAYNQYRQALETGIEVYDRVTYVVQKGEYITQLARKYNSTVEAILAANGLTDASKVTENRVLVIPSLPTAGNP
jgi:tetratricopeptide (TPR) repeat protein